MSAGQVYKIIQWLNIELKKSGRTVALVYCNLIGRFLYDFLVNVYLLKVI